MIDINELRRLAQAASPGPWWVNQDGLNHGFERGVAEINSKEWHALAGAWTINGAKHSEEGAANAEFIAAANPATVIELLDRLEAAEKAVTEAYRRGYATGQEEIAAELEFAKREVADLHDDISEWMDKRDALRAKIEQMEQQEPVAWLHETRRDSDVVTNAVKHVWGKAVVGALAAYSIPLYLAPGAQPAPSVPNLDMDALERQNDWLREEVCRLREGLALIADQYEPKCSLLIPSIARTALNATGAYGQKESPESWPTEAMVTAFAELFNVRDQKNTFGPAFRAALAAAPETKP